MPRFCAILVILTLAGCTQFPALDGAVSPSAEDAPYPDLVPLDGIVAQATPATPADQVVGNVNARVAALRARAARLRGRVLDTNTRRRMATGVPTR